VAKVLAGGASGELQKKRGWLEVASSWKVCERQTSASRATVPEIRCGHRLQTGPRMITTDSICPRGPAPVEPIKRLRQGLPGLGWTDRVPGQCFADGKRLQARSAR